MEQGRHAWNLGWGDRIWAVGEDGAGVTIAVLRSG